MFSFYNWDLWWSKALITNKVLVIFFWSNNIHGCVSFGWCPDKLIKIHSWEEGPRLSLKENSFKNDCNGLCKSVLKCDICISAAELIKLKQRMTCQYSDANSRNGNSNLIFHPALFKWKWCALKKEITIIVSRLLKILESLMKLYIKYELCLFFKLRVLSKSTWQATQMLWIVQYYLNRWHR